MLVNTVVAIGLLFSVTMTLIDLSQSLACRGRTLNRALGISLKSKIVSRTLARRGAFLCHQIKGRDGNHLERFRWSKFTIHLKLEDW